MDMHKSELAREGEDEAFLGSRSTKPSRQRTVPLSVFLWTFGIQSIALLATLSYLWKLRSSCVGSVYNDFKGYYPASEAISYYETSFQQEKIYKTYGDLPTAETDAAWEELQAPTDGVVQISTELGFEMDRLLPSITCPTDHSLHQYGLDVHHQLHCLDIVRKMRYPDHYFPNTTERIRTYHREHCIEHLRQSIMCSGDITLDRWIWDKEDQETYVMTDTPRVCRDFKKLGAWVEKYQFVKSDWQVPNSIGEDKNL